MLFFLYNSPANVPIGGNSYLTGCSIRLLSSGFYNLTEVVQDIPVCRQFIHGAYFIISSKNPSVSRLMAQMSAMVASSARSCTGL